ncbi:putative cytochrome p450 [Botryosphaeria dothidea]|uniref:Cytochrome p450 n=1 Tax=Botryosphaeria dothidea TaxID=55169 RepID=A0A8H4N004_9PEZI|nr:putative cytochrome p450 [Botryosphaeria dothidea]
MERKKAATSKDQESMSQQRRTALAIVEGSQPHGHARRPGTCETAAAGVKIYPKSLGMPAQDNDAAQRALNFMRNTFRSFYISVHEIIEDVNARKVCLWVICTGTHSLRTLDQRIRLEHGIQRSRYQSRSLEGICGWHPRPKPSSPRSWPKNWDESMSDRPSNRTLYQIFQGSFKPYIRWALDGHIYVLVGVAELVAKLLPS